MIETDEIRVSRSYSGEAPELLAAFIEQMAEERGNYLEEFRDWISSYEHWVDEMLIYFAEALALVKPISLAQFEPDWRVRLLSVAQDLYRIPRHIFRTGIPEEYEELKPSYLRFVSEAEGMGEDLLEFVISIEKGDFEDASDLLGDLREGLARLETMLTARWRAIARLSWKR